jgi:hypothetical protein
MTPNLPPDRNLPPARHDEIRKELIRTVNGRAARPMARWLVPAAAAVAVIAVTGGAVALSAPDGGKTAPPAASPTASEPVVNRPAPIIPGISARRAVEITRGCASSYGLRGDQLPPLSGAVPTKGPADPKSPTPDPYETQLGYGVDLRLYNLVNDANGSQALILGTEMVLSCHVDGSTMPYNAGGGSLQGILEWLPGPVGVDDEGAEAPTQGQFGSEVVGGRVAPQVRKVTVTFRDTTVTVTPLNGTYLVRKLRPKNWVIPEDRVFPVVRGYDADGKLVGSSPDLLKSCYVTPSGEIIGMETRDKTKCLPAVRWR